MPMDKTELYDLLGIFDEELLRASHPWDRPYIDFNERQLIAEQIERLLGVSKWRFSFRDDPATEATINIIENELLPLLRELKERGTPPRRIGDVSE